MLQGALALPLLGQTLPPSALALLLALMLLDIAAGFVGALLQQRTQWRILGRGLLRKVVTLLVILAAALSEQSLAAHGLPAVRVTAAVTLFYAAHESLSILAHAQGLGVPVPAPLQRFLQQLRQPTP